MPVRRDPSPGLTDRDAHVRLDGLRDLVIPLRSLTQRWKGRKSEEKGEVEGGRDRGREGTNETQAEVLDRLLESGPGSETLLGIDREVGGDRKLG